MIPCHIIYDVKHDGRNKSRFVAGGHRTSTPTHSVYSGVVLLQGIRLVTFLAELNTCAIAKKGYRQRVKVYLGHLL